MKRVPLVEIIRVEIPLETPVIQEIQEARLSRNHQAEMEAAEIVVDPPVMLEILLVEVESLETFMMMLTLLMM